MANSAEFVGSSRLYASQLNALRDDILDEVTGHAHTGAADGAPALPLSGLSDVNLSGAGAGDLLTYNGADWVPLATPIPATDSGPTWTATRTYTTSADMQTAAALTVAPTSGQKIVLDDIIISTDTAMLFELEMETSGNVLAAVRLPANGTVQITLRDGLKGDLADKKIFGDASVAGNVYITACYHSEA